MSKKSTHFRNVKFDVENSNQSEICCLVRNGHRQVGQSNLSYMTNVYIPPVSDNGANTQPDIVNTHSERNNTQLESSEFFVKDKEPCSKNRFSNIEEGLESSLGDDAKNHIARIVNDVKSLSDVEKLLLYLKLPSGDTASDELRQTPTSCLHVSNRIEQGQAYTWIKSHLEEDIEICLPKQEVYEDYKLYCENHGLKPLSTADFGKVMKCVFPNVKPRRLGQRGQSRYCYGGLRKKLDVGPPQLPELEISPRKQQQDQKDEDDELFSASCVLICEWAQKLLGNNFSTVRELAEFLVGNLYVNSKSVAAFTLIAGMQEAGIQNQKVSSLFSNTTGGDRHRETQLQLQRKLQERELVREQRRKIQLQKEENEQQIKLVLDRHTPLIFSPGLQQDSSPVRRIFDDEGVHVSSDLNTDKQRSKSVVCVGNLSPPLRRNCRSKSVFADVEMKVVVSSNKKVVVNSNKKDDSLQESMDTSEANVLSSQTDEFTNSNVISNQTEVTQHIHVDKEENKEQSSPFHTVRKPSFVVFGSLNIPKNETNLAVPQSSKNNTINQHAGNDTIGQFTGKAESISKVDTDSCVSSVFDGKNVSVTERNGKNQGNKDKSQLINPSAVSTKDTSLFINPSAVSSRSAFVPFSQVQCRNLETPDATSVRIPSISVSTTEIIECRNKQPVLSVSTESSLPSIHSSDATGRPVLVMRSVPSSIHNNESHLVIESNNNIMSKMTLCSSNLSASDDKCNQNLTVTTPSLGLLGNPNVTTPSLGMMGKGENNPNVTLPSSESQFSQPLLTSPSKKATRSRFTPIRPKASPTKTVSSILKEQKALNIDAPAYDTRPVATLLKEKRAREAEAIQQKKNIQPPVIVQNSCNSLPALSPGKTGEFVIILNAPQSFNQGIVPSTGQNSFSAVTTTTVSLTTSTCKSVAQTHTVSSAPQRFNRVRTNSSSERELDSPMPMSQDSLNTSDLSEDYTSATDEEKPSKMAKIVDSDQNVSSRPGSRCSPDRETPSFSGRKRKFFSVGGNAQSRKRMNSVDDDDDDVIIYDPNDMNKDNRRTRSCTFDIDEKDTATKSSVLNIGDSLHCPDISSLESDALLDSADSVYLLSNSSNSLTKQVHSTAVGVNSLSLRQSQQQLLIQKRMLDERMKSFLQKESDGNENNLSRIGSHCDVMSVEDDLSVTYDQSKRDFQIIENRVPAESMVHTEMEVGEEIPADVVDFITEKLTGIEGTNVLGHNPNNDIYSETINNEDTNGPVFDTNRTVSDTNRAVSSETVVEVDYSDSPVKVYSVSQAQGQNITFNRKERLQKELDSVKYDSVAKVYNNSGGNNLQTSKTNFLAGHLQANIIDLVKNSNQSETNSQRIELSSTGNRSNNFISPQTPARRQRTPSVEKILNQPSANYAVQQPFQRNRESSVELHGKQTPLSDAGYFSIGSSPISHSTPVSGVVSNEPVSGVASCESQALLTRNPSSLMTTRPDSAQSVIGDIVPQSPVPHSSPRFTSTPLIMRSPCQTPSHGVPLSPTDANGQMTAFMPIQGSTFKINSNVTLIKPVVTVASGQVTGQITHDLIGIGSIQPENKEIQGSPPSYSVALQSIQGDITMNKVRSGVFGAVSVSKEPPFTNRGGGASENQMGSVPAFTNEGSGAKENKMGKVPPYKNKGGGAIKNQTGKVLPYTSKVGGASDKQLGEELLLSHTPNKSEANSASQNLLPFSNYMALLSRKAREDKKSNKGESHPKNTIREKDQNLKTGRDKDDVFEVLDQIGHKTTNSTVNWVGQNKFLSEEPDQLLSQGNSLQGKPNIESILSLLKSYENMSNRTQDLTTSIIHSNVNPSLASSTNINSSNANPSFASSTNINSSNANPSFASSTSINSSNVNPSLASSTSINSSNVNPSLVSSMHYTSLPSSNYSGNAPNINLATVLPSKDKLVNTSKMIPIVEDVLVRRNLTDFLLSDHMTSDARRHLTGLLSDHTMSDSQRNLTDLLSDHTSEINEEELESTLDVLRSVDSQYFGQDDVEFDYSKRL